LGFEFGHEKILAPAAGRDFYPNPRGKKGILRLQPPPRHCVRASFGKFGGQNPLDLARGTWAVCWGGSGPAVGFAANLEPPRKHRLPPKCSSSPEKSLLSAPTQIRVRHQRKLKHSKVLRGSKGNASKPIQRATPFKAQSKNPGNRVFLQAPALNSTSEATENLSPHLFNY